MIFNIFIESALQAIGQLWANKLRSFLSLLGITIGIWCIVAVFSAIDSLEANIKNSFQKLGNDVVYISKSPWGEDPDANYWKYMRRPTPNYNDYSYIRENVNDASLTSFTLFIGSKTVKYDGIDVSNVFLIGVSDQYATMFGIEFEKGRFFSPTEYFTGTDLVILGYNVADQLFPHNEDPIGKKIKLDGRKLTVVGVIKKAGKDLVNPLNYDDAALVSYTNSGKYANLRSDAFGASIAVKAKAGVPFKRLKDNVTAALRAGRKLTPIEKDNFSLNSISIIAGFVEGFFKVMKGAGLFIGIFSIIVGVFSVANIMFVSVKERTNLIGIKKALGAKKIVILLEFLIEAIVLCLIGGVLGIVMVWLAAMVASNAFGYEIFLSSENIGIGIGIAVFTGIFAGIIPAYQAAGMDPVEAIRM